MKQITTIAGTFDHARYARLKTAYQDAQRDNLEQFTFEGNTLLTRFAHYLIQYLDSQFAMQLA